MDVSALLRDIHNASTLEDLDTLKASLLGKKGTLSLQMRALGTLSPEARKTQGEVLNQLKETLSEAFEKTRKSLLASALEQRLASETLDMSLPLEPLGSGTGRMHPLSVVTQQLLDIFSSMGFTSREGPDIEDDFHNFTALNLPPHHPARAAQDTFYFPAEDDGRRLLLRTHTSPVQIRTLLSEKPPLRIIALGRVFRSDHDQTHTPMFHQIEGLVVDQEVHMGHLKGCLETFFRLFFGKPVELRFRPSFFPFTEPSAEIDMRCDLSSSTLKIGEGNDWLEIGGCGMVHPQVLQNCGLNPEQHQGFAFGMGIERLTMLKDGIPDLRRFFENDTRWLKHYGSPVETAVG